MSLEADKWKFDKPNPRDRYFFKKAGQQALRKADQPHFTRQRIFRNTSFKDREKLPPLEKAKKSFDYSLPELNYPVFQEVSTLEEYDKILQDRIKNNEKEKHQFQLPQLQWQYKEKYSMKRTISQIQLKIQLEKFQ